MYGTRGRIGEPAAVVEEEGVVDDGAHVQKECSSGENV